MITISLKYYGFTIILVLLISLGNVFETKASNINPNIRPKYLNAFEYQEEIYQLLTQFNSN